MTDAERVTTEDLSWASGWLLAYEDDEGTPAERSDSDDEFVRRAQRVAAWLDRECDRRAEERMIRATMRATGATRGQTREAMRRVRERGE